MSLVVTAYVFADPDNTNVIIGCNIRRVMSVIVLINRYTMASNWLVRDRARVRQIETGGDTGV